MSFPTRAIRIPIFHSARLTHQRTFTSAHRYLIKEDAVGRSGEEIESKKREQLEKQKKGKGEWHEELASSGESNVKADRDDVKDHDKHMEELQKETAKKGEEGKI